MTIGISTKTGRKGSIYLSCRFDFNCTRQFRDLYEPLLNDTNVAAIEINMSGVEYVDSSALGMLLTLRDKAMGLHKQVFLNECSGIPRQVLQVANFDQLFEMN